MAVHAAAELCEYPPERRLVDQDYSQTEIIQVTIQKQK